MYYGKFEFALNLVGLQTLLQAVKIVNMARDK